MYTLFLKIATCYLLKNKWYSFINIFGLAGATPLAIALLTVNWQSFQAAVANPVDSQRDE